MRSWRRSRRLRHHLPAGLHHNAEGKLITGKTAKDGIETRVDVPRAARSLVLCGRRRFDGERRADYLRRKASEARKDPAAMRAICPVSAWIFPSHVLGEKRTAVRLLPERWPDERYFSNQMRSWLSRTLQEDRRTSPCPRTLRRLHLDDGSQTYRICIYSARRST